MVSSNSREPERIHIDNRSTSQRDGSEGLANVDQYGVNYIEYAKSALEL